MSQIVRSIDLGVQARQRRQELHLKKQLAEIELQKQGYEVTDGKITGGPQHGINQRRWNLEERALKDISKEAYEKDMEIANLRQQNYSLGGRMARNEFDTSVISYLTGEASIKDVNKTMQNNEYLKKILTDSGIEMLLDIDYESDDNLLRENGFFDMYDTNKDDKLSEEERKAIKGLYVKAIGTDGKEYIKNIEGLYAMTGAKDRVSQRTSDIISERLGKLNAAMRGSNVGATDKQLDLTEQGLDLRKEELEFKKTQPKTVKESSRVVEKKEQDANEEILLTTTGKNNYEEVLEGVATGEINLDDVNLSTDIVDKEDKKKLDGIVSKLPSGALAVINDPLAFMESSGLENFAKRFYKKYTGDMTELELEGLMIEAARQTLINTDIKYHAGAQTSGKETARMNKAYGTNLAESTAAAAYNLAYWKRTYEEFKDVLETSGKKSDTLKRYGKQFAEVHRLYKSAEAQFKIQKLLADKSNGIVTGDKDNPKIDYPLLYVEYKKKYGGDVLEEYPLITRFLTKEDEIRIDAAKEGKEPTTRGLGNPAPVAQEISDEGKDFGLRTSVSIEGGEPINIVGDSASANKKKEEGNTK